MREHPIIFSTEMVKAILEDRKTQTRRVIKPQPKIVHVLYPDASIETNCIFRKGDQRIHCPYGQIGDRLWVRETLDIGLLNLIYRADNKVVDIRLVAENKDWFLSQKSTYVPSIFMPRWASRITLEITGIRVERLQDITREDVLAEGVSWQSYKADYQYAFRDLWDSINTKRGYSWESNCWVWVIEFRRIKP